MIIVKRIKSLLPPKLYNFFRIKYLEKERTRFYNLWRYSYSVDKSRFPDAEIGSFTSIASGVVIAPAGHPLSFLTTSPYKHWLKASKEPSNDLQKYNDAVKRTKTIIGNDV